MATTEILKLQYDPEMAVFNNPLLIDHILTYVVFNSDDELLRGSDVAAIRLVARNWLQSTSRVIKKSLCISMEIILGKPGSTNELHGKPTNKTSKEILDNFVSIFGSSSRFSDSILTLLLGLYEEFFCIENLQCLKSCLEFCGDNLLFLTVHFPVNSGFKIPQFEEFNFPFMNKFTIYLNEVSTQNENLLQNPAKSNANIDNGLEFLQLILNGARNLRTLDYLLEDDFGADIKIIESIRLPVTLTQIISCTGVFNWDYALLMNNVLPNLRELRMDMLCVPGGEQLFQVLDRFRASLELLEFNKGTRMVFDTTTFIRLPLMPKLESFFISGRNFQKDPNVMGTLPVCLPKLRKFYVEGQIESYWTKWIEHTRFDRVSELGVNLFKDNDLDDRIFAVKSPSFKFMELLKMSFPNVVSLHFNLEFSDITILKVLFQEWTQLKELKLIFNGRFSLNNTPNLLASVLLGLPLESVQNVNRIFELSPDERFLNSLNVEQEFNRNDSILNLTELHSFTLDSRNREELPNGIFTNFMALLQIALNIMTNVTETNFVSDFEI